MASSKATSVLYTTLNRLLSYVKGNTIGVIDKDLFVSIRKSFKKEYKAACLFYNASKVSDLVNCATEILNSQYFNTLEKSDNITNSLLKEQYKSLLRTVSKCYDNINSEVMIKVVKTIGEEEVSSQKLQLQLLIKALIVTQIFTNMKDTINTTITNHGEYNVVTEYKNNFNFEILEQINECNSIVNSVLNINNLFILNESDDESTSSTSIQNDYYETGLLSDSDFTENDNNEYTNTIMHGNTKLDEFIFQLLYRSVMQLKCVINDIIDRQDIILMPNVQYVMFWLIVLLMHIVANY